MDEDERKDDETLRGYVLAHLWAFSKQSFYFRFF